MKVPSRHRNKHLDIFYMYCLSVLIIFGLSVVPYIRSRNISKHVPLLLGLEKKEEQPTPPPLFDPSAFADVNVVAKAYVVYDLTDKKVISSKNETTLLPLASVSKLMMAISAVTHKSLTDKITLHPESIEDGYDLGLSKGQVWSLGELLKYTLVFSSNDGAQAIADSFGGDKVFIPQMNTDAKVLGLTTTFTDPAGRDLNGKIGGLGTALDVAKLFAIARKDIPELLDATSKSRVTVTASNGRISGIPNTNQDVQMLPGAEASKTGFTDLAGGNLGVIVDITVGHPVIIVVLGSTREARFTDVNKLYTALIKSVGATVKKD